MHLCTETVVLIFNRLKLKKLSLQLYLWMTDQSGFELNDHVFVAAATCFVKARKWQATEDLYEKTRKQGVSLRKETFLKLMKEFTKARKFELVEAWFYRMKCELPEATIACNGLMLAYYKQKLYDKAMAVFDKIT